MRAFLLLAFLGLGACPSTPARFPAASEASEEQVVSAAVSMTTATPWQALPSDRDLSYVVWSGPGEGRLAPSSSATPVYGDAGRPPRLRAEHTALREQGADPANDADALRAVSGFAKPLAKTETHRPANWVSRAGAWAVLGPRLYAAAEPDAAWPGHVTLRVLNDATAQAPTTGFAPPTRIPLPGPCPAQKPPLLSSNGQKLFLTVGCAEHVVLLRVAESLSVEAAYVLQKVEVGPVELSLFHDDSFYLLSGRQVVRVLAHGLPVLGTVAPPLGDAETRELLVFGDHLLVVDGAAGRVIGMDRLSLGWKFERHFDLQGRVRRTRAAVTQNRLHIVLAEDRKDGPGVLTGIGLTLPHANGSVPDTDEPAALGAHPGGEKPRSLCGQQPASPKASETQAGVRLFLGLTDAGKDHQVLPLSHANASLLLSTHAGNTGPKLVLRYLCF